MSIHAHLSLVAGKYAQPPNTVLVPGDRKTFPVRLQLDCECEQTHVVGAPDRAQSHEWCVLDEKLRQVMVGGGGKRAARKRVDPNVARTIMGGGAPNPQELTVDLVSAKLRNGGAYTLIYRSYGVTAACDFVAIHDVKKAAPKKKRAARKKKAVKRKVKRKAKAVKKKVKKKAKAVKKKVKAKTRTVRKKVRGKKRAVKKRKTAKK